MLDIAQKHIEELKLLHLNTWYDEKYKFYNYRTWCETPKISENTWDYHDFVSLNKEGKVIGGISYSVNRDGDIAYGLGIINFTDDMLTFGKDVHRAVRDVFEKFSFHKLKCSVVIGNPIEATYDRLITKYGGRIVGIDRQDTKLWDGKYYDVKRYEILKEDYFKCR